MSFKQRFPIVLCCFIALSACSEKERTELAETIFLSKEERAQKRRDEIAAQAREVAEREAERLRRLEAEMERKRQERIEMIDRQRRQIALTEAEALIKKGLKNKYFSENHTSFEVQIDDMELLEGTYTSPYYTKKGYPDIYKIRYKANVHQQNLFAYQDLQVEGHVLFCFAKDDLGYIIEVRSDALGGTSDFTDGTKNVAGQIIQDILK